jgi:hypothetical protein
MLNSIKNAIKENREEKAETSRRNHTARFLLELLLAEQNRPQDLDRRNSGVVFPEKESAAAILRGFDLVVRPREIRLLPRIFGSRHVAVIREWEHGLFLCLPLSQYASPATSYEFLIGENLVAQAWNSIIVPEALLEESWVTGKLNKASAEGAFQIFRAAMTGVEPPPKVLAGTGMPIFFPEDPRKLYQDLEAGAFREFRMACFQVMPKEDDPEE